MDSESSSTGSTPSPPERLLLAANPDTPLSTITNIPKRILLHPANSKAAATFLSEDPENKENIVPFASFLSPGKRRCSSSSSSSSSCSSQRSGSCSSPRNHQMSKLGVSPAKGVRSPLAAAVCRPPPPPALFSPLAVFGQPRREPSVPFSIFTDDEKLGERSKGGLPDLFPGIAPVVSKVLDDGSSADEPNVAAVTMEVVDVEMEEVTKLTGPRRAVAPGSMEDILSNCSPGKEEGVVPLGASPPRQGENAAPPVAAAQNRSDDGFDLDTLATITEDSESESPRFDLTALLSKKIILPSHLESSALYQQPCEGAQARARPVQPPPRCVRPHNSGGGFKRPLFRRALSMLDAPSAGAHMAVDGGSSSSNFDFSIPGFKRPNPPSCGEGAVGQGGPTQSQSKRRKCSPSSLMSERSTSLEEETTSDCNQSARPKFHRSHSENELSIMKSCQLKEEVENILPDSTRYFSYSIEIK